jgi:hypothetical protein
MTSLIDVPLGQPTILELTVEISIINALWRILTEEKLNLEDPHILKILKLMKDFVEVVSSCGTSPLSVVIPRRMTRWPIIERVCGLKTTKEALNSVLDLVKPYIAQHKETMDENNIRDLIDLMLLEQQKTEQPGSCFYEDLGEITIANTLVDLFIAGIETTSSSLVVFILQILHHPDVQERMQMEIDEVRADFANIGSSTQYNFSFPIFVYK